MKKKVLIFVDRLRVGGIQTLLVNLADHIDQSKFILEFLVLDDGTSYELEDEFRKKGFKVHKLSNVWIKTPFDYYKYAKEMNKFFEKNHDYVAVHMNSSSKNYMVLKYAQKYNIKIRIAHSHNIGFQTKSKLKIFVGDILKAPMKKYATHFLACSNIAGQWLFGESIVDKENFFVLKNGINIPKFAFNKEKRERLRNEYAIENKIVIGHVGRFTNQKNHDFLIDVFNELHKQNEQYELLLIGKGENETAIKEKVEKLGLSDSVIFAGFHENVNEFMQAMDMFLFPSLYEGLGIVLIEAQAAGLPSYTSSGVVPEEAHITPLLNYVPLSDGATRWANIILQNPNERKDYITEIKAAGYDIEMVVKQLEQIYSL